MTEINRTSAFSCLLQACPCNSRARHNTVRLRNAIARWLLLVVVTTIVVPGGVLAQGVQDLTLEELMEVDAGQVFGGERYSI